VILVLVGPAQNIFFLAVHYLKFLVHIAQQGSKLGRQSCRITCFLVGVSGADFSNNAMTSVMAWRVKMMMAMTAGVRSYNDN
jgi:hypothetical protein